MTPRGSPLQSSSARKSKATSGGGGTPRLSSIRPNGPDRVDFGDLGHIRPVSGEPCQPSATSANIRRHWQGLMRA